MPRSPARAGRLRVPGAADARSETWRGINAVALLLAIACGGDDGKADAGLDDGASGTTGEAALPVPAFAEPASGQLSLPATRAEDLELTVQGVMPGRTELVIDERSLGPLGEDAIAGRLDEDTLVLRVRGSMVEGLHRVRLRNADASGMLDSEMVEVRITAELDLEPTAGALTPSGLAGTKLVAMGEGDDAILVVLEPAAETPTDDAAPRLHLVPRGASGWDVAAARTITAAGLSLAPDERVLPAAALRRDRSDDDPGRVRVAFRVGTPGSRIDLLDVAWEVATPEITPQASLTVEAAVAGRPAEWAELGRPWLVADLLVAELWAPVDVESSRPGDRTLVSSRVRADVPTLDPPQRVSVTADLVDLDRLGPALDHAAAEVGAPAIFTIRADQRQPLVLEPDPTGGLRMRPTVLEGGERTFAFVDLPLASVVGAFGSRTVAGLTTTSSGRMRVALLDDLGEQGLRDTSLGDEELPAFDQVTGEIALGSIAGIPVFLVPYGPELPVHAVRSTGLRVEVTALPELQCDAVALAPSPDAGGELPLACARDGELWIGSLHATPVP